MISYKTLCGSLFLSLLSWYTPSSAIPESTYIISIDGLQPQLIKPLIASGHLSPQKGLGRWTSQSAYSNRAIPILTTLTAPSHVSTITCTSPANHGIVANQFLLDGKSVSGFEQAIKAEPFWSVAVNKGLKVLNLGFIGTLGQSNFPRPTHSIAYPSSKYLGSSQTLDLTWNDLTPLSPVDEKEAVKSHKNLNWERRAFSFTLIVNPETMEKKVIYGTVEGQDQIFHNIDFDDDQDLTNGILASLPLDQKDHPPVDLYFTEDDPKSPLLGYKRRLWIKVLENEPGKKFKLYISRATYNNAHPESFRKTLDKNDLIFPDFDIKHLKILSEESFDIRGRVDTFLAEVGDFAKGREHYDLILVYQSIIDTLGHGLQNNLSLPFNPKSPDEASSLLVKGWQVIDQNLQKIVGDESKAKLIAVFGDHGMDKTFQNINLAALGNPKVESGLQLVPLGGMALIYNHGDNNRSKDVMAENLKSLKQAALALKHQGKHPISDFYLSQTYEATFSSPYYSELNAWPYGQAIAAMHANSGYSFTFDLGDESTFIHSKVAGMHGHTHVLGTMTTGAYFFAPEIRKQDLGTVRMLDVVPTIAKFLNIPRPTHCQGKAIGL